ncbi:acyl carrier protein [Saccharothrix sp. Mg75]|uniref:acyl carrier protein n=1 Tax=Saccharothrix sp. Mg75 TaxID=3445357 RepID=UPI003EED95C4
MAELTLDERDRVKGIVCEALDLQPEQLADTADFKEYGVESVQVIEIITIIEDELDVTIDLSEAGRMTNLAGAYEVVAEAR